jgi:hypothetical protein
MLTSVATMMLAAVSAPTSTTTRAVFKKSEQTSGTLSRGYALFPTVGKGALVIGAGHGSGKVYRRLRWRHVDHSTERRIQAGGEGVRQIIFFENKAAFDKFTAGNFEFAATAQATAITANVSATAGTTGARCHRERDQERGRDDQRRLQRWHGRVHRRQGGLMYEASVAGQKFSYKPRKK